MSSEVLSYELDLAVNKAQKTFDGFMGKMEARLQQFEGKLSKLMGNVVPKSAGGRKGGLLDQMLGDAGAAEQKVKRVKRAVEEVYGPGQKDWMRQQRFLKGQEERERRDQKRVESIYSSSDSRAAAIAGRATHFGDDAQFQDRAIALQEQFAAEKARIQAASAGKTVAIIKAEMDTALAAYKSGMARLKGDFSKQENTKFQNAGLWGKRTTGIYMAQQAVEDFQYAGWRGAANNIAFLAASLGGPAGLAVLGALAAKSLYDVAQSLSGTDAAAARTSASMKKAAEATKEFISLRKQSMDDEAAFRIPKSMEEYGQRLREVRAKQARADQGSEDIGFTRLAKDVDKLKTIQEFYKQLSAERPFDPLGKEEGKFSADTIGERFHGMWRSLTLQSTRQNMGLGSQTDLATLRSQLKAAQEGLSNPALAKDPSKVSEALVGLEETLVRLKKEQADATALLSEEEQRLLSVATQKAVAYRQASETRFKDLSDRAEPDFLNSEASSTYSDNRSRILREYEERLTRINQQLEIQSELDPMDKYGRFESIMTLGGSVDEDAQAAMEAEEGRAQAVDKVLSLQERITDEIKDQVNGIEDQIRSQERLVESAKRWRDAIEESQFSRSKSWGSTLLDDSMEKIESRSDKRAEKRLETLHKAQRKDAKLRGRAEEDFMEQNSRAFEDRMRNAEQNFERSGRGKSPAAKAQFDRWKEAQQRGFQDWSKGRGRQFEDFMERRENMYDAREKRIKEQGEKRTFNAQNRLMEKRKKDLEGKAKGAIDKARDFAQDGDIEKAQKWFGRHRDYLDEVRDINLKQSNMGDDLGRQNKRRKDAEEVEGRSEQSLNEEDVWAQDAESKWGKMLQQMQTAKTVLEGLRAAAEGLNIIGDEDVAKAAALQASLQRILDLSMLIKNNQGAAAAVAGGQGLGIGLAGGVGAGLPGFAEGGQMRARMPAIVGERGPELFVPKSGGTIFSNADTRRIMARSMTAMPAVSTTSNTSRIGNVNISTQKVDVDSFQRRLRAKQRSEIARIGGNF